MRLTLDGLGFRVAGSRILEAIDGTYAAGTIHVLLGPGGAGKTSLLRLIAGLERPSSGRLRLARDGEDADITQWSPRQRDVAMVYQEFVNYPSLTVYENIASPLRLQRVPEEKIRRSVVEMAERLQLTSYLERLPAELSGGEQQRCAIGRALVKNAALILLDEPLANLDFKLRENLQETLIGLLGARDSIAFYATTDPEEALIFAGTTTVLDRGRVLQRGPAIDVYRRPRHERVGALSSDPPMNVLLGIVANGCVTVGDAPPFPLPPHAGQVPAGAVRIGIRAHDLILQSPTSQSVPLQTTVELAEVSGSTTRLHLQYGNQRLVVQQPGLHPRTLGAAQDVFFRPGCLFFFSTHGDLLAAP